MNLSDIKTRFSRRPNRADPAHAFGSEEQLMEEFQRQTYTPPQARTSNILFGLRDRLTNAVHPPRPEAPVYSADTYARESAPDLGWEAAFSPQEAAYAPREEIYPAQQEESAPEDPLLSAQERFEAFRQTVYSSPTPQTPDYYGGYPQSGFYQEAYPQDMYYRPNSAPLYEEIQLRSGPRRENTLPKAVYEDLTYPRQRDAAPPVSPYESVSYGGAPESTVYAGESRAAEKVPAPDPLIPDLSDISQPDPAFFGADLKPGRDPDPDPDFTFSPPGLRHGSPRPPYPPRARWQG